MALTDVSGDEDMADNEFNNFTILDEDLLIFKEGNDDQEVLNPTDHLKQILKISNPHTHAQYPYENPYDLFVSQNLTDSSDDDNAGAAIMIQSKSKSEEEADPYWAKIKIDELQGLGNPMRIVLSNTDSMPDLEIMSESDESVVFILTPPNLETSQNETDLGACKDFEMLDLVEEKEKMGFQLCDTCHLIKTTSKTMS